MVKDNDSTEVKYKISQWSLPGATVVPVLNVSGRVFWLELDDKALLDSFSVMCFRRNVLLLGKAHVVNGLQLASCCQAAKMQMIGSTSCYPRRTSGLPSQRGV